MWRFETDLSQVPLSQITSQVEFEAGSMVAATGEACAAWLRGCVGTAAAPASCGERGGSRQRLSGFMLDWVARPATSRSRRLRSIPSWPRFTCQISLVCGICVNHRENRGLEMHVICFRLSWLTVFGCWWPVVQYFSLHFSDKPVSHVAFIRWMLIQAQRPAWFAVWFHSRPVGFGNPAPDTWVSAPSHNNNSNNTQSVYFENNRPCRS